MRTKKDDNLGVKISFPIISNLELAKLDYTIEHEYESIFDQVSRTISHEREIIILKRIMRKQHSIIEKQRLEIERLKRSK